jgi:hypothetical protein
MRSLLLLLAFCISLFGQNNYEIQVYRDETVAPHQTMIELHSNFTFEGFKTSVGGFYPDQLHETIEITRGFTD